MTSIWDQRYGTDEYAYGVEPNDFLRAEAHRIPLGPVLCLAEGEGRNAVFLAGPVPEPFRADLGSDLARRLAMLTHNESSLDRAVRLVLGIALLALVFVGPKTLWGLIGIVPIATGLVGFCPLYRLIGLSTCPVGGARKQGA